MLQLFTKKLPKGLRFCEAMAIKTWKYLQLHDTVPGGVISAFATTQ